MENYSVAVVGGHFDKLFETKPRYKFINSGQGTRKMSDIELLEQEVNAGMDAVQVKIDGINVGVLEILNYIMYGENWYKEDINKLYSYLKNTALNGIYLQQFLEKNNEKVLLVENFIAEKERLGKYLAEVGDSTKYVIISTTHMTSLDQIMDICQYSKSLNKNSITIVGGALVRQLFDQDNVLWKLKVNEVLLESKGFIDVFIDEKHGEDSLLELIHEKETVNKEKWKDIQNIIFYDDNDELIRTRIVEEIRNVDSITVDYSKIEHIEQKKYLSVLTSRGCPHHCKFCTYHKTFKHFEPKSLEVIKKELDSIPKGKYHIRFADDNFAVDKNRLINICKMIIEAGYEFTWSCMSTPHSITEETAKLMKESGCKLVFIGVESANNNVLKNMNKTSKVEDYYRAIKILNEVDIETVASIIIGYPGETQESIKDNINFINNSCVTYFQVNLLNIMPSMEVFQERHDYGLKGLMYGWRHNTLNSKEALNEMMKIIVSAENALTNGFGIASVQATIEYLLSQGYILKEVHQMFRAYTKAIKKKVSAYMEGKSVNVETDLIQEISAVYELYMERNVLIES